MEAWPFLFAKSPNHGDWRPVAFPPFIDDREARRILMNANEKMGHAPGGAVCIRGEHSKHGIIDMMHRRVPSGLTDKTGRRFDFFEGFLLRERIPTEKITQEHFEAAHDAVMKLYDQYRTAPDWTDAQCQTCGSINLSEIKGDTPVTKFHTVEHSELLLREEAMLGRMHSTGTTGQAGRLRQAVTGSSETADWFKPSAKGAIICATVAAVAIGGFLIAAHLQRSHTRKDDVRER